MRKVILSFFCAIARGILSLRYKVEIRGLEYLNKKSLNKKDGVLFLPNHPAHMDPILLTLHLWPKFQIRPLAIEYVYRQTGVHFFMKLIGALPIPNFESSINEIKMKKAEEVLDDIAKGLKQKKNYMLYPAGKLKRGAKEVVGGASATHNILSRCPGANVVLIRTVGLWGSIFSRAITGKSPDFKSTLKSWIKMIFKNGIFFTPRRRIVIDVLPNPNDFPWEASRLELNRYLENWYNQYPSETGTVVQSEPLQLVSRKFWTKDTPKPTKEKKRKKDDFAIKITDKMQRAIYAYLAEVSESKESEIHPEMNLALDLGLDSLDIGQTVAYLSDHFDAGEVHPEDMETVKDVLEIAAGRQKGQRDEEYQQIKWPDEPKRLDAILPSGDTIQAAFLHACERMDNQAACGDDIVGIMSYKQLKQAALVLALEFQKMPGKRIGILLPASSAAYICILAALFANKVPVMLNWTMGPRYLEHMIEVTGVKTVISSWRFLERLAYVEFGELTGRVRLLEDIKQKIGLKTKIKGFIRSLRSIRGILRSFKLHKISKDDTCVILFTSGTEAAPKGVPLTHNNILTNQRAAIQCTQVTSKDVFFGILPPFHSFGFSVAGLLPLLSGIKVAYYPDPTDSYGLAEAIPRWGITIFCSAPSFMKGLFQAAKKTQLRKVRLFVSGAEKAPQELFDKVHALGSDKQLIEGYGITECSPILTINRPSLRAKGVGRLIPGVELRTIHPETQELLSYGKEGEICVLGPNVFHGYLAHERDPFIELEGRTWYRTGDIGYLDEDGNLILSGRLKRFTKIGGEMISLGAVEEAIIQELRKEGISEEDSHLAVCAHEEGEGKAQLILFCVIDMDRKAVNQMLRDSGFSRLVKISDIKILDEIPLMGTGKVDYRRLQSLID